MLEWLQPESVKLPFLAWSDGCMEMTWLLLHSNVPLLEELMLGHQLVAWGGAKRLGPPLAQSNQKWNVLHYTHLASGRGTGVCIWACPELGLAWLIITTSIASYGLGYEHLYSLTSIRALIVKTPHESWMFT